MLQIKKPGSVINKINISKLLEKLRSEDNAENIDSLQKELEGSWVKPLVLNKRTMLELQGMLDGYDESPSALQMLDYYNAVLKASIHSLSIGDYEWSSDSDVSTAEDMAEVITSNGLDWLVVMVAMQANRLSQEELAAFFM